MRGDKIQYSNCTPEYLTNISGAMSLFSTIPWKVMPIPKEILQV
jgi:hypothetical protein